MAPLFQWQQDVQIKDVNPDGTVESQGCGESRALVLAGSGRTDGAGQWSLDVRPALCFEVGLLEGASLVATPTYSDGDPRPVFVTTELRYAGPNLVIGVRSWDDAGGIAPYVPFSWHMVVGSVFV